MRREFSNPSHFPDFRPPSKQKYPLEIVEKQARCLSNTLAETRIAYLE